MPYGRIRIRPIQWQLRLHWSQSKEKSSKLLPLDLAGINCIWHLVPGPIPTTHQCPGASSHMAWPKSFQPEIGECEGCSHVRPHVSGCLPEKSGGHQIARNERFSMCLWSEKRGITLVPCYLPGHLNVLADHLSRRGQILKTEWSLNQTVADRIFRAWGRPFVDLFALGKNTKIGNVRLTHSGGDIMENEQSCPELGRPVRVCVPSDKPV